MLERYLALQIVVEALVANDAYKSCSDITTVRYTGTLPAPLSRKRGPGQHSHGVLALGRNCPNNVVLQASAS